MPKIIAIGGVSRSGKSTLALWLHKRLNNSVILCQDDFPNDEANIPVVKERTDWERPESVNWQHWQRAIESQVDDCDYLILEGLFIFRPESIRLPIDFSYYLSMDKDTFMEARAEETRWGPEPHWYLEHVWNSHFLYGLAPSHTQVADYYHLSEDTYPEILSQIRG